MRQVMVRHGALGVLALLVAGACSAGSSSSSSSSAAGTTSSVAVAPATTVATAAAPVPAKYQAIYEQTSGGLDAYVATLTAMPVLAGGQGGVRAGFAELLDANGNRQTALLAAGVITGVDSSLDAFKRMGLIGVVVGVKMPLLLTAYTAQAAQYDAFYQEVAQHVRARGMSLDVELGALFCGTVYSQCSYTYPATVAGWASITAQQARAVIAAMHPDYLDLISEPNTEVDLTHITGLGTVSGVTAFVTDAVGDIGAHGTTKLVAGAASWYGPAMDAAIVKTPVDGLVVHVYPASAATAANLVADARIAHGAGKPIVADEVWLYKGATTAGGSVQSSNEQGFLNTFSFWAPLDARFIAATREWAAKAGSPLVSGFWSWQTFAYVTWTPQLDATPIPQELVAADTAAGRAMAGGTATATGRALGG